MPFTHSRRTFMSVFTSLAGVAAVESEVAGQAPTGPTDLAWLAGFRGRHKQAYDYGGFDLTDPLPPLRFPRRTAAIQATRRRCGLASSAARGATTDPFWTPARILPRPPGRARGSAARAS
jgi:hypothetical protein